MRKRYWLFIWDTYYPAAGTAQVDLKFDTMDEVEEYLEGAWLGEYGEILDLDTGNTFNSSGRIDEKDVFLEWIKSLNLV